MLTPSGHSRSKLAIFVVCFDLHASRLFWRPGLTCFQEHKAMVSCILLRTRALGHVLLGLNEMPFNLYGCERTHAVRGLLSAPSIVCMVNTSCYSHVNSLCSCSSWGGHRSHRTCNCHGCQQHEVVVSRRGSIRNSCSRVGFALFTGTFVPAVRR